MTECVLIFEADITLEQVNSIFSEDLPGTAVQIFKNSFQLGADASYSSIRYAISSTFPKTSFALAKTKEGKMIIVRP